MLRGSVGHFIALHAVSYREKNFAPHCVSSHKCIKGYRRNTVGEPGDGLASYPGGSSNTLNMLQNLG